MSITTEASPTPDGPGTNQGEAAGGQTQSLQTEARLFTQEQVDSIIKSRLAEQQQKLTAKLEKTWGDKLTAALAERETAIEATIQDRVTAKLNEQALASARQAVQGEYGLSEAQLARLTGSTPEELKADAEALFGALKTPARKPPVLLAGNDANPEQPLDLKAMTPAQIRENAEKLRQQLGQR